MKSCLGLKRRGLTAASNHRRKMEEEIYERMVPMYLQLNKLYNTLINTMQDTSTTILLSYQPVAWLLAICFFSRSAVDNLYRMRDFGCLL